MMLTLVPMVSHDKKVILPLISITMTQGVQWCHWWCHQHHMMLLSMASHEQNVMLHFISIMLIWGMQWFHWWCCWHHMMSVLRPMALHDQRSHVALHFNCLDLWNAVVSWMSAPCDDDASTSGITWPTKSWCMTKECSGVIDDAGANGITWPKKSCCISFWLSWPKKYNGAIDDGDSSVSGITWPKCHVASHFDNPDLRNAVGPLMMVMPVSVSSHH